MVLVGRELSAPVGVYVIRATVSPRYESVKIAVWKLWVTIINSSG